MSSTVSYFAMAQMNMINVCIMNGSYFPLIIVACPSPADLIPMFIGLRICICSASMSSDTK
jgi:hypothetical protein